MKLTLRPSFPFEKEWVGEPFQSFRITRSTKEGDFEKGYGDLVPGKSCIKIFKTEYRNPLLSLLSEKFTSF